jgi:hypothetical protein
MHHKRPLFLLSLSGITLIIGGLLLLLTPRPVAAQSFVERSVLAQCGSQTSSCKDCHEVQGKDPVNNDGTGWHQSHAFGDFCILCHAGNEQATDKDAAHVGMVPPLADVKASCQSCHPSDINERAQVYAKALNISLGGPTTSQNTADSTATPGTSPTPPAAQSTVSAPVSQPASVSAPASNEVVVNDPNAVDYVQRYNEIVLGERPVNWGNIILAVLIGLVVLGGGGFVILNEVRLRTATRQVQGEYPAEVVDMLPALADLKPQSRQSLRNILRHPQKTDKVLGLVDTLVSDDKTEE